MKTRIMTPEKFIDELDEGLGGEGDLVLGIFCKNCGAQYELNHESCAMAIITSASFIEYVRYVQNSKCPACEEKKSSK